MTRRSLSKNPFKVKPRFFGESARLKHWEGGFHTALEEDFAAVYAQQKWETSPFKYPGTDEDESPIDIVRDYPVLLTMDMAGIPSIADIDARRACVEVMHNEFFTPDADVDVRHAEEFASGLVDRETEYPNVGDPALNAMFQLASCSSMDVAWRLIGSFLDGMSESELLENYVRLRRIARVLKKNENARLSLDDNEFLVEIFKQSVYWEDISDDRLIAVRYMHPCAPHVRFSEEAEEAEEDSQETDDLIERGYHVITDTDYSVNPQTTKAWHRESSRMPLMQWAFTKGSMGGAGWMDRHDTNDEYRHQRIEYHGTSLSNLLAACPWLAEQLAKPPKPFSGDVVSLADAVERKTFVRTTFREDDAKLFKNPRVDLPEAVNDAFPLAGRIVDGREVINHVDNQASIGASLVEYVVVPGVREVPLTLFSEVSFYNANDYKRAVRLAAMVEASGEIMPLIVVVDKEGVDKPYVLEGQHRLFALQRLGAASLPALVVVDLEGVE